MKILSKRHLLMIAAAVLIAVLLPVMSFILQAGAVTIEFAGVADLEASYTAVTDCSCTATGTNGLTVTAKTTAATGCGSDTVRTITVTLKNTKSSKASLSFDYAVTLNSGTITIDGTTRSSGGSFSKELNGGASITVSVKSGSKTADTKLVLSNITLIGTGSATVTFKAPENGTYTVNGAAITSDTTQTNPASLAYELVAVPTDGYQFLDWYCATTDTVISTTASATQYFDATVTVYPRFVPEDAAVFMVKTSVFTDLNEANTYASSNGKVIVLAMDGTLPSGNYTITNGNTLLIPFDSANTKYTTSPPVIYGSHEMPTAYRTMTMAAGANITVNSGGAISLSGKLCSSGQMGGWNGTPTGPDGRIEMRTGSTITLLGGANLYCWGYIYGSGSVVVNSNATVYEAYQVKDWRGGTAASNCYSYVFPFNQYYIQNIEVPMTMYAGAKEQLHGAINASSKAYEVDAEFIGSNGMFRINGGYLIKDYLENTDQLSVMVYGDVKIAPMTVRNDFRDFNTGDYEIPITNNIKVHVQEGTVSLGQDVKLQPGVEVVIERDAKFEVTSGYKLYAYDLDDWRNFSGSAKMYAIGYSVANGTTNIRTTANMSDVTFDVNGVLEVAGTLYTSAGGANITSSEGTSGTNGRVVFTSAPPSSNKQISEMENNSDHAYVTFSAPQMHNGDGSYQQTVGTGTSTWYYDKDGENWYRYKVDMLFNGSFVARGYYCELDDTLTYDADWLTNLGASVTSGSATVNVSDSNVVVTGVTADTVVTLTGVPAEYAPTFVLNEKEYEHYQFYTGQTLSETVAINDETYYVVDQGSVAAVGTAYAAPTDAAMGESAENHNEFLWNLSGGSFTSGDPYRGTVPVGPTAGGPAYIYGFYDGAVAYNSFTDEYYRTLAEAMAEIPQDGLCTVRLVNDCGAFEEESSAFTFPNPKYTTLTLDLNGHHGLGGILNHGTMILELNGGTLTEAKPTTNNGTMTVELNGGTLEYHTGATAAAASYQGVAAIINSGTLTVQDSVGGGTITADAISNSSSNTLYAAGIRNNAGAHLTMTGGTIQMTQTANTYSTGIMNISGGTIDGISNTTITTQKGAAIYNNGTITGISDGSFTGNGSAIYVSPTGTLGSVSGMTLHSVTGYALNNAGTVGTVDDCVMTTTNTNVVYNNGGTITSITDSSMTVTTPTTANVYALYNYGGTITTIDGCTIKGNSGIENRNIKGDTYTAANGSTISKRATITTISDTEIEVGYFALRNRATIGTLDGCTFTAHPATKQVNQTSGTAALNSTNQYCYTIYNDATWWAADSLYKRVDDATAKTRTDIYLEGDEYRPTIGSIIDCTITAENTSTSATYGYALVNLGIINTIGGETTIQTYKHPNNASSITSNYGLQNIGGGIIRSIEGTVTISASGDRAISNEGQFTTQTVTTYPVTVGTAPTTHTVTTYGKPSEITSITASGTISAGSSYGIYSNGYIGTINSTGLTIKARYSGILNSGAGSLSSYDYVRKFTDATDASTEYERVETYTRNLETGGYIGTINGITLQNSGAKGYFAMQNQGHIGTLSNVTVELASGATPYATADYPLFLNGDSRQTDYTLTRVTNYTADNLTTTDGTIVTRYDSEYHYDEATIDLIDNVSVVSSGAYAFENRGKITMLKDSTITASQFSLVNYWYGSYGTKKVEHLYSATSLFGTTKTWQNTTNSDKDYGDQAYYYTRIPAEITTIDNCTITTPANTYALKNGGHIGTIKNSTITAGTTTAKSIAIFNGEARVREYSINLDDWITVIADGGTTNKIYFGMNGESKVVTYDYDQPVIDLIGEGNTITATTTVITNNGVITAIDSGEGTLTTITGSSAKGSSIYNYSNTLDTRTTTTPYTEAASTPGNGTAGTATNADTYHSGAVIGTIKNVYINANGYGIRNGDAAAGKTPTIGEIGEGTEIYAHCTTTGYHAIYNQANAKITSITGGVYTTTKATTNAYKNNNTAEGYATVITGGDFKGMSATRANAIFEPDNTSRQTYGTAEAPKVLSSTSRSVNFNNGTTVAAGTGYYYLADAYTVTFNVQGHGTAPDAQTVESGKKATAPTTDPSAEGYTFGGWYKEAACTNAWNFTGDTVTADTILYAKWTALYTVTWKNGDDTLETDTDVAAGTVPTYDGETPTKAYDETYHYTFSGWDTTPAALTGDMTYTAQFTPEAHSWNDGEVTTPATCTAAGVKTFSCTCGATKTETVNALGHTPVTDAAVPATCTETGLTEGSHCSVCNAVLTAQEVVPANGHTVVIDAAVPATCTATGLTEGSHCSVCNAVLTAQEVVPANGHTVVIDAADCSVCNAVLTAQEVVPANGHTVVIDAAVPATCTETGLTEGSHCSICNAVLTAQTVTDALGHDLVEHEAKTATCSEVGWAAYQTCTRCDYTTYEEIAALDHDLIHHEAQAATCTAVGWNAYDTCSRCDYTTYEEIAMIAHTPDLTPAAEATCTKPGSTAYYTCSECGKFFSDEECTNEIETGSWVTDALGHNFVDGFCTRCGLGKSSSSFKINSAKLAISNDIIVSYTATVSGTLKDPYMVFTFNEVDYRVESSGTDDKGRYLFNFEGVTPEKMGDNICATLYATTEGEQLVHVTKASYSVREYCVNTMNKYYNVAGADVMMHLLSDILVYGGAAQNFTKYHTDAIVTEGVNMEYASTFTEVTETKLARTGEADPDIGWNAASLRCGSQMAMTFTFFTNEPETTTVEVTINGRKEVFDTSKAVSNGDGTYTAVFTGIAATEFDDTVTAILKKDGVQIGQTLTYSVNSYVYSKQNDTAVENLAALVKAVYNYGCSAKTYAEYAAGQ